MKFQVLLQDQAVAEWARKYIDYKGLKKLLRSVEETAFVPSLVSQDAVRRPLSSHSQVSRDVGGATAAAVSEGDARPETRPSSRGSPSTVQHDVTLQRILCGRPKAEFAFFQALDRELEKIDQFYRQQETYFLHRMDLLKQQVQLLTKEKQKVARSSTAIPKGAPPTIALSSTIPLAEAPSSQQKEDVARHSNQAAELHEEENGFTWPRHFKEETMAKLKDLTDQLRITNGPDAERAHLLAERKREYTENRRKLKRAVYEHYRGAGLLKSYKSLNHTGFVKILKKFDKVASWKASDLYLPKVNVMYFSQSALVDTILLDTEALFIQHFENGVRRRAMEKLRLPDFQHRTYHAVSWRSGILAGVSFAILWYSVVWCFDAQHRAKIPDFGTMAFMYAGLSTLVLFVLLFGVNLYVWSHYKINYEFIFEFDPRSHLHFHNFFELGVILLFTFACSVFVTFSSIASAYLHPALGSVIFAVIMCFVLFNPFDILYKSARWWMIETIVRILSAPWKKVEFRDFFICDELNSLGLLLLTSYIFLCASISSYEGIAAQCNTRTTIFTPLVTFLPALFRFLQCLRRYNDTKHSFPHLLNAGKYSTSMLTIWMSFVAQNYGAGWTAIWVILGYINQLYTTLWDLKMDWGFFEGLDTEWSWQSVTHLQGLVRKERMYADPVYVVAMVANILLRSLWVILVNPVFFGLTCDRRIVVYGLAVCEMIRRWNWNFFRLENEHLNNCGQFRATKDIPLPFPIRPKSGIAPPSSSSGPLIPSLQRTTASVLASSSRRSSVAYHDRAHHPIQNNSYISDTASNSSDNDYKVKHQHHHHHVHGNQTANTGHPSSTLVGAPYSPYLANGDDAIRLASRERRRKDEDEDEEAAQTTSRAYKRQDYAPSERPRSRHHAEHHHTTTAVTAATHTDDALSMLDLQEEDEEDPDEEEEEDEAELDEEDMEEGIKLPQTDDAFAKALSVGDRCLEEDTREEMERYKQTLRILAQTPGTTRSVSRKRSLSIVAPLDFFQPPETDPMRQAATLASHSPTAEGSLAASPSVSQRIRSQTMQSPSTTPSPASGH